MLLDIVNKKKKIFLYPRRAGYYKFINSCLRNIGRQIDNVLDLQISDESRKMFDCPIINLNRLSEYAQDEIAVFIPRYHQSSQDIERDMRKYGLLHNHHYFYIEDFTTYPIKEYVDKRVIHAPWAMDGRFLDVYDKIRNVTLLDIGRCYELKALLQQTMHLGGNVLEAGVFRGGSAFLLAAYATEYGKKVYCADTFRGFVDADPTFDRFCVNTAVDSSVWKSARTDAENLFAAGNLTNYEILEGDFPDQTAHSIARETFCFCHIDTDVYHAVRKQTEWIWDRLVVGGIIVFDDYGFIETEGVTRYVDEITHREDRLFVYNLNGHGILVKMKE